MRLTIRPALSATLILFLVTAIGPAFGQSAESEATGNGPADLSEAIAQLDILLKPEDIETLRNGTEEDMINYHFGLGMSVRNRWGLWNDSELARWFYERGVHHPDEMSWIILTSYWRHLHGLPPALD